MNGKVPCFHLFAIHFFLLNFKSSPNLNTQRSID